ncbi:MAG: hypothetical protein R3212_11740, partial [Xanthomonadales bacterium]|nr:hypothetical protein [Xanthomonadales bacterium]
ADDGFNDVFGVVQPATPQDLEIKGPFIGQFRGSTRVFDDGETEYHFVLHYDWWDQEKSVVKYTVNMVIPSQDRSLLRSEGFYGFDRFTGQLMVFGVFSGGMIGQGYIGQFDHQAGTHEIWARSMDAEGVVTWVRDGFEVIDENRWRNRTMMRRGEETGWQEVHQDTYTRID